MKEQAFVRVNKSFGTKIDRKKNTVFGLHRIVRPIRVRGFGSAKKRTATIQPVKSVASNDEKKSPPESFHVSMSSTLLVARALGLFPVLGLRAPSAQHLSFRLLSPLAIASSLSILPEVWIVIVSCYYVVRSLSSTTKISGGVANSTAGAVFYGNNMISAILLRSIARGWPGLAQRWRTEELAAPGPHPRLKTTLHMAAWIVLVCALTEHFLSMAIQTHDCRMSMVEGDFSLAKCLKEYCIRSHAFIFTIVSYNIPTGLLIFLASKLATFIWNFQDLFLIQISLSLVARFKHINSLVYNMNFETALNSDWRNIRELYAGSAGLAREAGTLLAPLVLLSFINNLYFICLQMLNGLAPSDMGALHSIYFFGSFALIVLRVTSVALAASAVPLEARRALPALRCCPTRAYCVEVERLTCQLVHDEVALTGLGFFTVNRNFMLGVAGAIATYEVVLLQFDTSDDSPIPQSTATPSHLLAPQRPI